MGNKYKQVLDLHTILSRFTRGSVDLRSLRNLTVKYFVFLFVWKVLNQKKIKKAAKTTKQK